MQTFLPVDTFNESVRILDFKRLGKQRVEALQILELIKTKQNKSKGFINHPAVRMWRGYEVALQQYLRLCLLEWQRRGGKNTMEIPQKVNNYMVPWWLGDDRLHSSHRSKLLWKYPPYYECFGWLEFPNKPYWWPEPRLTNTPEYVSKRTWDLSRRDTEHLQYLSSYGLALRRSE